MTPSLSHCEVVTEHRIGSCLHMFCSSHTATAMLKKVLFHLQPGFISVVGCYAGSLSLLKDRMPAFPEVGRHALV